MDDKLKDIGIIAVGGGASNMLNAIIEQYPSITATLIVNRDQVGIKRSNATKKILMNGLVASELDRLQGEVEAFMQHKGGVILLACLGGCTGSNFAVLIAATAKALNIPVLVIVSLPFDFEGKERMEKAMKGLKNIEELGVRIASYSNQQLMDMVDEDTSLEDAFKLVDTEVWKVLEPYLAGEKVMV